MIELTDFFLYIHPVQQILSSFFSAVSCILVYFFIVFSHCYSSILCLPLRASVQYILPMNEEEIKVRHEKAADRFAARLDGKIAYLSYEEHEGSVLDYAHVFVPEEFRGKGIAGKITQTALDWARKEGYSVIPSCPYVSSYIEKHEEYRDIVKQ